MKVSQSRYYPKPNQWREIEISEVWLRQGLAPILQQMHFVVSASDVDRVILSDSWKDGKLMKYKLTFSISRRKEV